MPDCEFVSIDDDESSFLPKIVTFQNGQLKPNSEDKLQCAAFTDSSNNKTMISVATEKMVYVGEEKSNNDLFYTLLALRNKKTNKIRLVPVSTVSLNVHIPKVNALLDATLSNTSLGVRELKRTFGSKKTIRKLEQNERMKLNISGVEDEIRQTVADIEVKPEDMQAATMDDNYVSYRPPMNRHAGTIEEVYDINQIIAPTDLDSLKELAAELLSYNFDPETLSPLVVRGLEYVANANISTNAKLHKCKILMYIEAVLKYMKTPMRQVAKMFQTYHFPQCIHEKIYLEFSIENETRTRLRPISIRDKVLSYIMVLTFMVFDYTLDMQQFSTETGNGIKKIYDIAKVLGAHIATGRNNHKGVLKVPLLPTPMTIPRKTRK